MSTHTPLFREIAILGPGLLGTSLTLALQNMARVRLWGRRAESIVGIRHFAGIATTEIKEAIVGADLVIFCTPIEAMGDIARQIEPFLGKNTIVTDVGSVKTPVVATLEPIFGHDRFLGSHPMAGSEQSGSAAAKADLFAGAACIITPTEKTSAEIIERLTAFWQSLDCNIYLLPPALHDQQIALISHLPHLLAGCLVNTVAATDPKAFPLAGQGFRDTTRIASGPPEMWRGILQANRPQILAALHSLQKQLALAEQLLQNDDAPGLRNLLANAKTNRDGIIRKARYGGN